MTATNPLNATGADFPDASPVNAVLDDFGGWTPTGFVPVANVCTPGDAPGGDPPGVNGFAVSLPGRVTTDVTVDDVYPILVVVVV